MGTWLTVEALRQMAIRNGGIPAKIENVILAAPDLDVDVFRQQLADMGPKRPSIHRLRVRDDNALKVSRRISGNVDRLGAIDIRSRYIAHCSSARASPCSICRRCGAATG
jgi:esterase/lipase superfamily enzyme